MVEGVQELYTYRGKLPGVLELRLLLWHSIPEVSCDEFRPLVGRVFSGDAVDLLLLHLEPHRSDVSIYSKFEI